MRSYILSYNDLIEVYDKNLFSTLENISYSTDSYGNEVEVCRCRKFQKQDPQFIVFKVKSSYNGEHYFMLQGSIDLFKSVFPEGEVGDPFIKNFNKVDIEKFLNSLSDTTINNESEVVSRLVEKFKMTENKAKEIYHGYCGDKEFSKSIKSNFSERLRKLNFALSNTTMRVLKVKFDPKVTKLVNLNKFLATFKMLPIVSDVKLEDDTIVLTVHTNESEVGVSEIINAALAKVASNVTYHIIEE